MTVCIAAGFVSCGEDDVTDEQKPVESVDKGTYSVYCPSFIISYWPDSEAGIVTKFEAYYENILNTLKVDEDKQYEWSYIEANKDRMQKLFDGISDFEYSVKSCRNYTSVSGDVTFRAYKNNSSYADIDFGAKRVKCTLDVPADATVQLQIEMSSVELVVPSAKDYLAKVRNLYIEALKDVFTEPYGNIEKLVQKQYLNMLNYNGDPKELKERVKKICEAVVIPEIPADVKNDAQSVTTSSGSHLNSIFAIRVFTYDPKSSRITMSYEDVFTKEISLK